MSNRHRWPLKGESFFDANGRHFKTERACLHGCGIIKVTRHEWSEGKHWIEFYRGLECISKDKTPECVRVGVEA